MRYIRTYEELDVDMPKVGDYVIIKFDYDDVSDRWPDYICNNVGKIVEIHDKNYTRFLGKIDAKYYLTDEIISSCFSQREIDILVEKEENGKKYIIMHIQRKNILYYASSVEDLEMMVSTKKYNL